MSTTQIGLVNAPSLPVYDLGADHPFARHRQRPLFDLLDRMGLRAGRTANASWGNQPTRPATRAELLAAHSEDYLTMVEAVSEPNPTSDLLRAAYRFGLGTSDNPIASGQHESAAAVAGATIGCVESVMRGELRHAFNPAGGLHHAQRATAAGFCVYNDLVAGVEAARRLGADRVLYIDFDVHHGDGVEFAFDQDPQVMTISFHQSPQTLYPGTGHAGDRGKGPGQGSVWNMPFAPGTGDANWLAAVRALLPAAARAFRPDLILSQHGCDPHRQDPLANLQLTTRPMYDAALLTKELAEELCDGRWVATGGGGYRPYHVIPRAWTLVWLAMTGQPVPAAVDPAWCEAWQEAAGSELAGDFFDANPTENPAADRSNDAILATLLQELSR